VELLSDSPCLLRAGTGYVDPGAAGFLRGHSLPEPIILDLTGVAYSDWLSVGNVSVTPANELQTLNRGKLYRPWFADGYVTIGGGLKGDHVNAIWAK
jgi:hypothetical protein